MEILRAKQKLNEEMDIIDMEEYRLSGTIHVDFRYDETMFKAIGNYDFLNNLSINDEIMLTNEDTGNLSPFIICIDLDDDDYKRKKLTVTRKVYSPMGLDIYVVLSNIFTYS